MPRPVLSLKSRSGNFMSKQLRLIGLGLDDDGHTRITQADDITLVGGSQETHERMQETAIKITEEAKRRGIPVREMELAMVRDVLEKMR